MTKVQRLRVATNSKHEEQMEFTEVIAYQRMKFYIHFASVCFMQKRTDNASPRYHNTI